MKKIFRRGNSKEIDNTTQNLMGFSPVLDRKCNLTDELKISGITSPLNVQSKNAISNENELPKISTADQRNDPKSPAMMSNAVLIEPLKPQSLAQIIAKTDDKKIESETGANKGSQTSRVENPLLVTSSGTVLSKMPLDAKPENVSTLSRLPQTSQVTQATPVTVL